MTVAIRTRVELEDALTAWVELVLPGGRKVVGWPTAPRPQLPYVTIRISDIVEIGQDDRGAVDLGTGVQIIYGDRLLTLSVQAFGPGALDLLRKLANSIWKQSVSAVLLDAGLSPMKPGLINDLTGFLETSAEERGHVDMVFGFKDTYEDNVGVIEHVTGDGTIRNEQGTYLAISFAADLS